MNYRREIDGLRALAVVPVILFHAGVAGFAGGYVGVDVFFVISGYLITSIIATDLKNESFSIRAFYERRFRRILPPLVVMSLVAVPFAWIWMFPYQLVDFAQSLLAIFLLCSNVLFWKESGYFMPWADEKPMLHTWSLSVEEQYYLVFPLLLALLWKFGVKKIIKIFLVIILIGIMTAEYFWRRDVDANFYLTHTRIWEILVGAVVGLVLSQIELQFLKNKYLSQLLSAVGLGLIGFSVVFFNSETPSPGLNTLVPILGTVFVIIFAHPATYVGALLSMPLFVGIGLISYSAYLWHQPIFAFARLRVFEISHLDYFGLTVLTFGVAFISWKFVERPFRDKNIISSKLALSGLFGVIIILFSFSAAVIYAEGFPGRFTLQQSELVPRPDQISEYRRKRFDLLRKQENFSSDSRPKLAIVGDSFAEDFVNMVFEAGAFKNYEIVTHMVPARCQIYLGKESIKSFIAPQDYHLCGADYKTKLLALTSKADVIVLAGFWKMWAVERLNVTVQQLGAQKTSEIYVLGMKVFGTHKIFDAISMQRRFSHLEGEVYQSVLSTDLYLKNHAQGFKYVSLHDLISGTEPNKGYSLNQNNQLVSNDGHHLTLQGAQFLGELVFSKSLLSKYK